MCFVMIKDTLVKYSSCAISDVKIVRGAATYVNYGFGLAGTVTVAD